MANPPECLLRCVNSGAGALRALSHVMLSAWVQKLVALKFESTCLLINPLSTLVSLEELKVCNLKDLFKPSVLNDSKIILRFSDSKFGYKSQMLP